MKNKLSIKFILGVVMILGVWWGASHRRDSTHEITVPSPSTNIKLSETDLAFGRQQVEQMMHDRSEMATCVERGDIVYQGAVRQFAGEAAGQHIYWNNNAPYCSPNCLANSQIPRRGQSGFISISARYETGSRKGHPLGCENAWAAAVFELFNIAGTPAFNANDDGALAGKISKQEWVTNITKAEFRTMQRTSEFYRNVWKPWAESKGLTTEPSYWYIDQANNYDQ